MGLLKSVSGIVSGSAGTDDMSRGYKRGRRELIKYTDKAAKLNRPGIKFGLEGMEAVRALFANPNSIKDTPGYAFRFNQGTDAVQNSAASKGKLFGGETLTELTKFGQEFASNEFDKEFNRRMLQVDVGQKATASSVALFHSLGEGLAGLRASEGRDVGGAKANAASDIRGFALDSASKAMFP